MFRTQLLIDGAQVEAKGGEFERRNPVTNQVATRAAAASPEDAVRAVTAAAQAFPAWSALGPNARRAHLQRAAEAMRARAGAFVACMVAELGAHPGWAHFNVHLAAGMLDEAAAITTQVGGEVIPSDVPGVMAFAVRRPAGVVVGMAPWNAPVILGVRAIAAPLACGNTVVLKASETCPATHTLIGQVLHESGMPAGVVNVITHASEQAPQIAEALISQPAVRRVSFTGSTRVGRIIGELAARHLKPAVLELGGKAPMLVLDDADLEQAVAGAAFGAFMNQGQICMSTERVIVDRSVADAFVAKFKDKAQSLRVGRADEPNTVLTSVVDPKTCERLDALVEDAVANGASVVCGGKHDGVFYEATVVDRVTPDMRLFHEESFGPIVAVIRAANVDDAVALANQSDYGLSSAVFGRDVGRALGVAQRIEAGICHINGATVHDEPQMPFGGTKGSGYGRFGGRAGVDAFTELQWITVATQPRHYPI